MIRARLAPVCAALGLLVTVPIGAQDEGAIREAVAGFYAHYGADDHGPADWDWPFYTAETSALIARWQATLDDGDSDTLSDFGWLCECQDWDSAEFSAEVTAIEPLTPTVIRVSVRLHQGWGSETRQVLTLHNEQGRWLIADIAWEPGALDLIEELQTRAS